jgi:hypothetical protein
MPEDVPHAEYMIDKINTPNSDIAAYYFPVLKKDGMILFRAKKAK